MSLYINFFFQRFVHLHNVVVNQELICKQQEIDFFRIFYRNCYVWRVFFDSLNEPKVVEYRLKSCVDYHACQNNIELRTMIEMK